MGNIKSYLITFSVFIALFAFVSCEEDATCNQNQDAGLAMLIQKASDQSQGQIYVLTPLLIDTLYPKTDGLGRLPIHNNDTYTRFVLKTDSAYTDVIEVYHSLAEPEFLSIHCGFATTGSIDSIKFSTNFLDSIWLIDPIINTDVSKTNIIIYH